MVPDRGVTCFDKILVTLALYAGEVNRNTGLAHAWYDNVVVQHG
jgi:hypothetical protein